MPRISSALHYAACLCMLAGALSGCVGLPQASSLAPLQQARPLTTGSSDLLYLGENNVVEVYTFPGGTYQDTFDAPARINAMCSDSHGNVYLAAMSRHKGVSTGYVYEYAHGGNSPINTLGLPSRQIPVNCSSDPATGNLAVTSYNEHNFAPEVEIYTKGGGKAKVLQSDALGADPQPAYDDKGNLFVTSGGNTGALLGKGKQSLQPIKLDRTLGGVAHAQWDGKYFALQSFQAGLHQQEHTLVRVYRVQISGTKGTIVGYSLFHNWRLLDDGQSWIQGNTLLATPNNYTGFWKYPSGGKALKIIRHPKPIRAITVSVER
jgi:hypothetical protein